MGRIVALLLGVFPTMALAAGGGVGEGFGADDWISKWPVLLIVVALVVTGTSLFSIRIFRNARSSGTAEGTDQ